MSSANLYVEAWRDALTRYADAIGGHTSLASPGVISLTSDVRLASLNGITVLDKVPDETRLLAALLAYKPLGPWSLHTRSKPPASIIAAASERGLMRKAFLPLMARKLPPTNHFRLTLPEGVTVRPIDEFEAVEGLYANTLADAFEAPRSLLAPLVSPAIMSAPGMQGFLIESWGVPVATSFSIASGTAIGLVNIGVIPSERGRGFGAIATLAAIVDAWTSGATSAYLHSSPMGLGLYRRLGFKVIETWFQFSAD